MAIPKRTRFEVLRRDNYTCRYCRSTEGALTIDHVTPNALGGTDEPSNLVAACRDCNAGKASSAPDAATVAQVTEDAMRWAAALRRAAEMREAEDGPRDMLTEFYDMWCRFDGNAELPDGWEESVLRFHENGMTISLLKDAAVRSLTRSSVASWHKFRYFCGICWKVVGELREEAEAILEAEGEAD